MTESICKNCKSLASCIHKNTDDVMIACSFFRDNRANKMDKSILEKEYKMKYIKIC